MAVLTCFFFLFFTEQGSLFWSNVSWSLSLSLLSAFKIKVSSSLLVMQFQLVMPLVTSSVLWGKSSFLKYYKNLMNILCPAILLFKLIFKWLKSIVISWAIFFNTLSSCSEYIRKNHQLPPFEYSCSLLWKIDLNQSVILLPPFNFQQERYLFVSSWIQYTLNHHPLIYCALFP